MKTWFRIAFYSASAAVIVAAGLLLTGCASDPLTSARQEVIAASDSVTILAGTADTAVKSGLITKGSPVATDIKIALGAASSALSDADVALQNGNAGGVDFYVSQVSAALVHVSSDLTAANVPIPATIKGTP